MCCQAESSCSPTTRASSSSRRASPTLCFALRIESRPQWSATGLRRRAPSARRKRSGAVRWMPRWSSTPGRRRTTRRHRTKPMEQEVIDRMYQNLRTTDKVKCGWAKIVLDILEDIEQLQVDARAAKTYAEINLDEAVKLGQKVESERDFLQAQLDNMADTIKRSKQVEAMRQAMIDLIPRERPQSARCWCPPDRETPKLGHLDNCMRARVACEKEK